MMLRCYTGLARAGWHMAGTDADSVPLLKPPVCFGGKQQKMMKSPTSKARVKVAVRLVALLLGLGSMLAGVAVVSYMAGAESLESSWVNKVKVASYENGRSPEVLEEEIATLRRSLVQVREELQTCMIKAATQPIAEPAAAETRTVFVPAELKADEFVFDLHKFLGFGPYYHGINWEGYQCVPPLRQTFPAMTDDQFKQEVTRLADFLAKEMALLLGKASVAPESSWEMELKTADMSIDAVEEAVLENPKTLTWRKHLTWLMGRYMLKPPGVTILKCPEEQTVSLDTLGRNLCPSLSADQVIEAAGVFVNAFLPVKVIAESSLLHGWCNMPPHALTPFGQWFKQAQLVQPRATETFLTTDLQEDAVALLSDVMWHQKGGYKRQRWLGGVVMTHPSDLMAIGELISQVKPDLIIETGSGNGGSALFMASMLHLNNIQHGKVITIDVTAPFWTPNQEHWGGKPRVDVSQNELWQKYVTFFQGSSTQPEVIQQVQAVTHGRASVLVVLDGHKSNGHVREEMKLYCPFVTVGSYCVIEGTVLSRFTTAGGLKAAHEFVAHHPNDFSVDRDQELMFSNNIFGYLKRTGVQDLKPTQ